MKRIEKPPRIIYADRHLGLALVCLYFSGLGAVFYSIVRNVIIIWLIAAPFGIRGLLYLFYRRDFVIERDLGTLVMLQQRLILWKRMASYNLRDLEVWVLGVRPPSASPAAATKTDYQAWIYEHGQPVQGLIRGRDLEKVHDFGSAFARDLGRPCHRFVPSS